MAKQTNNQSKCPVCGRFTSEKSIAAYEERVKHELNMFAAALNREQERSKNLGKWLDERHKAYEAIKKELDSALEEIHYLRSRSLWDRILNR